jgi:hypothetical protein
MQGLISEETKLIQTDDLTAAGTDAVNGTGVDMQADGGWDGVRLFVAIGTPNAANLVHAEQSDDNGVADSWEDIADSEMTVDTDDDVQRIDILRPAKRYVRLAIARGASTALSPLFAELYRPRTPPYAPTADHNVVKLVEPIAGTK